MEIVTLAACKMTFWILLFHLAMSIDKDFHFKDNEK